jgi:nucleoside-diphosphate-sugar epimerase
MLTMQALTNSKITVFGGQQTRPNIHMKDMIGVYLHFLELGEKEPGIFNAGFENISILDIAKKIVSVIPAEIVVTESNDPRSYRQDSTKLLKTGFNSKYSVNDGITDVIKAYENEKLIDSDQFYNVRSMKKLDLQSLSSQDY